MTIVNCTKKNIICLINKYPVVIQSGEEKNISDLQVGDVFELQHMYKSTFNCKMKFLQLLNYFPVLDWIEVLAGRPYMNIVVDSQYCISNLSLEKIYVRERKIQLYMEAFYDCFLVEKQEYLYPVSFYCPDADEMKVKEKKTDKLLNKFFNILMVAIIFVVCNAFYDASSIAELLLFQTIPLVLWVLLCFLWKLICLATRRCTLKNAERIENYFNPQHIFQTISGED